MSVHKAIESFPQRTKVSKTLSFKGKILLSPILHGMVCIYIWLTYSRSMTSDFYYCFGHATPPRRLPLP